MNKNKNKRPVGRPVVVEATQALVIGCSPKMKEAMKEAARLLSLSTSELARRIIKQYLLENTEDEL